MNICCVRMFAVCTNLLGAKAIQHFLRVEHFVANNVSGFVGCGPGEIVENVPVILVVVHSNNELRLCIV